MKQTQLTVAAVLLAVMVFVVVFAMNYIGGGSAPKGVVEEKPRLELVFAHKVFPTDPNPMAAIEREDKMSGHQDFWFCNTNPKPVKVGLNAKNCKCTNVEVYVLPPDASARLVSDATAVDGPEALAKLVAPAAGRSDPEQGVRRVALDKETDHAEVPPGGVGWVRLNYKGEKPGPQGVSAKMWMDDMRQGPTATLELRLVFHEILRAQPTLNFGTLSDDEIANGVTRHIYCVSSIRRDVKPPVVTAVRSKGDPATDPLVIGKPVPLSDKERAEMEQRVQQAGGDAPEFAGAKILSAFRIPVTVNAMSADGKTPFDVGPFRRRVLISLAESDGGEPKSVTVHGRVRGLLEIGADEEGGGEVNFRSFPRVRGSSRPEKVPLSSDTPGVKLEVDEQRTAAFLKAKLTPVEGRSAWTLHVEVRPGMASGPFPRRDPLYEDSAVYLKATAPGKSPRSLRISVSGTATEG